MKMKSNKGSMTTRLGEKLRNGLRWVVGVLALTATVAASAAPVNDNFANATVFTGTSASGTTVGATRENGEPTSGTFNDKPAFGNVSIWWKFTPTSSGAVTFRTRLVPGDFANDSGIDTQLGVYTGSNNVANLTEIISAEDAPSGANGNSLGGGRSEVTFNAVAGTTYSIMVNGYNSEEGPVKLYRVSGGGGGGGGGGTNQILTVNVTGSGAVSPNLNGRSYPTGKVLSMTAVPARGFVFNGWTGGITSPNARLVIPMRAGLTLTANFVPNPFLPVRGFYNGLYSGPTVEHATSGYITFLVNDRGQYVGRVIGNGRTAPFRGVLNGDGVSTFTVRQGTTILTGSLQLDLTNGTGQANGTLTGFNQGSNVVAQIQADRLVYDGRISLAPLAGQYNVVFARNPGINGDGIAIVNVDRSGKVRISGSLADGTRFGQSTAISSSGQVPLYASLYRGGGSLLGYLNITSSNVTTADGVSWIKPARPDRFYSAGFDSELSVLGSRFTRTVGAPLVNWTNVIVNLAGGNLATNITTSASISLRNALVITGDNPVRLRLSLAPNGVVRGSFVHPVSGRPTPVQGLLLQNAEVIRGYFLGVDQAGYLKLSEGAP